MTTRPLVERIRELATYFPELNGRDPLSMTVKAVVLPQLARAAAKDPDHTEALIQAFARRFVAALEIPADVLYGERVNTASNTTNLDSGPQRPS